MFFSNDGDIGEKLMVGTEVLRKQVPSASCLMEWQKKIHLAQDGGGSEPYLQLQSRKVHQNQHAIAVDQYVHNSDMQNYSICNLLLNA